MRRQIKFPFLLLLVFATLPAQAELTTAPPNFFLGVDAGIPFGTDQPALIRQGVVSRVGGSAEVNQDSIGINGRLFAGYRDGTCSNFGSYYLQHDCGGRYPYAGSDGG